MNPGNYSSPTEARAERRRNDSGTFYRDRRRSPEDKDSASLARDLAQLAEEFPRFRGSLNRLRHHVLVQMRSEDWKCQAVLQCLSLDEPAAVEEIVEETDLDHQSINQALACLEAKGAAAKCNRNGGAVLIRRDNKPAEKIYWKKQGQSAGAGSSR